MCTVSEWEWDPETYLTEMAEEIPGYDELQEAVVAATAEVRATRVLELGTGTGETALKVQAIHPETDWLGIDASEPMLTRARERLPGADLRLQRLEDELPPGPFDLVVSALAVHHLDGAGKRDLFSRVARVLQPDGVFVLGDVVVPAAGQKGPIHIDWVMDKPDSVEDQLGWLGAAGFDAEASSVRVDLAVFRARLNAR
jgi:tRNA (cmo5U34)-methyltransferase